MITLNVTEADAESRLDRYLRRNVDGLTQGVIQKLCRTGKIRVGGLKAEANAHVAAGDVVTLPPVEPNTTPKARQVMQLDANQEKDLQAMILYRDDAVIVLDKPAGLATQGGTGIKLHLDGMLDAFRFGNEERPKLVHRLDRDTSGILILARTAPAARKLTAAFRGRDVEKTYWAVLAGLPQPLEGRIDLALKRVEMDGSARAIPAARGDKEADRASTGYAVIDHAGNKFAWVRLQPYTGRMHQLRAHCLAMGTPIIGDAAYGGAFPDGFAPQLHLHARRLAIAHPDDGLLTVEAAPPAHFSSTLKHLGFAIPRAAPPKRARH